MKRNRIQEYSDLWEKCSIPDGWSRRDSFSNATGHSILGEKASGSPVSPEDLLLVLAYQEPAFQANGFLHIRRVDSVSWIGTSGHITIGSGPMEGYYSLVAEPYSPGTTYNRIFLDGDRSAGGFHVDGNGLLFEGAYYHLNLWRNRSGDCSVYRSDGVRGRGWLSFGHYPMNAPLNVTGRRL